jgi:hypothetical protein
LYKSVYTKIFLENFTRAHKKEEIMCKYCGARKGDSHHWACPLKSGAVRVEKSKEHKEWLQGYRLAKDGCLSTPANGTPALQLGYRMGRED